MIVHNVPQVLFSFHKSIRLNDRKRLTQFLISLFKENNLELDRLHYVFCDDDEILTVNQTYLRHDYYTDIITFDMRERSGDPMTADIFISIDTVRSNALLLGESVNRELHRVIFHGALHLCGYNDKTKSEQVLMRGKEDEYLSRYGL